MDSNAPSPLVRVDGLVVRFGATVALDGVDIDLRAGEIHAIVGENGAGKSTLLRALHGSAAITGGSILRDDAVRLSWVPQETALPADLTAAEWIFLGAELRSRVGWLRRKQMSTAAEHLLHRVGCQAPASIPLGELPLPQRKQVQIARAVRERPDVLLIDEPTAVLGERETEALFSTLRELRAQGVGIFYISHHLDEVMTLADRVTVLRDGRRVATSALAAVDVPSLVRQMVGRDVAPRPHTARTHGAATLTVSGLAVEHVEDVSFSVHAGEIVGLAGLVGAGRSEILEAVVGLRRRRAGTVSSDAVPVLLPEDRGAKGLVPTLNLRENLFLPADSWRVAGAAERRAAASWVQSLRIRTSGTEASIDSLSGGNQQKLLMARALRRGSKLLLLDEPTAGVDIGAKAEIHDVIRQQGAGGAAVLVASSDLPELLHLCDRIIALRLGRVAGVVGRGEATEARVGALITGGHEEL